MTIPYAIDVRGLRKSYGSVDVLTGLDLQVKPGGLVALLGPNGAGKTTTVRILATLLRFDAGEARIFGHDVVREATAVRRRVSVTGQYASLDDDLTGSENLVLIARLLGFGWREARRKAEGLLDTFGLSEAAARQVKHYSGGMRRRLDIAATIVVAPDLLFLDEPTTGLDPRSRRSIWEIVRALREAGTTVLLTTQYLDEADALADRIVILDQGAVIADGTPGQLKASIGAGHWRIRLQDSDRRGEAVEIISRTTGSGVDYGSERSVLKVPVVATDGVAPTLSAFADAGIEFTEFSLEQPALEDVFLALTGSPVVAAGRTEMEMVR